MVGLGFNQITEGSCAGVYERMSAEDAQDYDKLKEELLKRFRLTEGGYRKKFKGATRENDETARSLANA